MKKISLKIARSYTAVLAQHGIIYGISLLTFGIIARILDTHDIGIYGLTVSVIYLIGLSANFGLKKVSIRIISQNIRDNPEKSRSAFWLSTLLGFISIALISFVTAYLFKLFRIFSVYPNENQHYILLFILLILFSFKNHISSGLEALKQFHVETAYIGTGFVIYRILMIILVIFGLKIYGILISWIIGESIALILILYSVVRSFLPMSMNISVLKEMSREAPPLFISDIILSTVDYGDRVLTSLFGYSAVAFFYIASTGAMALGAFAQALYSGMLPHLSEEYAKNGNIGLVTTLQSINRYVYIFIAPIYLLSIALSYPAISILVGPGYSQAAAIFQILAIGLWISSIAPINQTTLIATGKGKYLMYILLFSLGVEFLSIILLYPYIGILATGFGKALLLTLGFILSTFIIMKELGTTPIILKDYIKPTIAGIIASVATWIVWMMFLRIDLFILYIIFGLASYMLILRLLKVIDEDEVATLYLELPLKEKVKYIIKLICYITGVEYNKVLELVKKHDTTYNSDGYSEGER